MGDKGKSKEEDKEAEEVNEEEDLQEQLAGELSASLRSQLLHLKEMVQRDYIKKKEYKEDVVNSVKQQLQVFASALGRKPSINTETGNSFKATADTTTRQSADNSLPDLAKALEQQLRAFYSESS